MRDVSPFVPFDLYDFFGYLFPGILFSVSTAIFFIQFEPGLVSILLPTECSFLTGFVFIVSAIVILYTLGHFIATFSHIIIDRVLIDGIEGYPINFLLDIPRTRRPYSENTFKYLFASFNLLLFIPIFNIDYSSIKVALLSLVIIIIILIILRIIIMLIRLSKDGKTRSKEWGALFIFKLFLYPAYVIDIGIEFFRRLLGLDRPFPKEFIVLYKKLFIKRFPSLHPNEVGSENYWLSSFHANSESEVHKRVLYTWLHLYGFARNSCAALYLSSSLIVYFIYTNPIYYTSAVRTQLFILWIMAAILGLRYWILYSHYYSKGVFRAFVESMTRKDKK
jgi:hypothetical protein